MDLPQLLALARRVGREEFVQRFDHPFLSRPRLSFTSFGQDEPGVVTDVRPFDSDAMRPATVRSVPKLHALFWPADDLDGWAVSDARSANGTWLNEKRLAPLDKIPIKPGDL